MFTFTFDHGVSDGAGGYGAVCVNTPDGDVWYVGRDFARTVLVERFPARLTYADADNIVRFLSARPTGTRRVHRVGGAPIGLLDCVG